MSELYNILTETPPTKVVLLALDQGLWDCERSLAELAALCEANHMEAVAQISQKRQTPETGIVLGSGKLEEASLAAQELGAECAARCLEELLQKDIDGVIIEPSKSQISCRHLHLYERLEEYGIPYVFIQGCFDQMEDKPQVLMDDCRGGHLITKYLLDTGHRDIAGVFKADDIQGQNRHRGYVQALQEAGVLYDPDKVIWFHTEDRKVHPQEGIRRLISKGTRLDSVVCYNDQIAMQVIPTLTSRGIRVPEDISVTGYDNSYMAIGGGFQLTTIVHPQEKLGEMAAQLLLSLLHGESLGPEERKILIQPELVVGNTTC